MAEEVINQLNKKKLELITMDNQPLNEDLPRTTRTSKADPFSLNAEPNNQRKKEKQKLGKGGHIPIYDLLQMKDDKPDLLRNFFSKKPVRKRIP